PPAPLAAVLTPAGGAAGARGGGAGGARLLLRPGLRADRHADPDRRDRRARGLSLPDGLLRRAGVPRADRSALRRGRLPGVPQGLLLRSHVPRGEVEDPAPLDGVLDGGAG